MMKLSISNIAWGSEEDHAMYQKIRDLGFQAVEIAPTRIFPDQPYDHIHEAKLWAQELKKEYDLEISSMQSIWYGRTENIFGPAQERETLFQYTLKAFQFAYAIGCHNLVFGCPRNRNSVLDNSELRDEIAREFFGKLGEEAAHYGVVFALEPNPVIYHTNYLNITSEVAQLLECTGEQGLGINLDFGTIIYNEEDINNVYSYMSKIHHVHISEPELNYICQRSEHLSLLKILKHSDYEHYVSIEMKKGYSISEIVDTMKYIKELCENVES